MIIQEFAEKVKEKVKVAAGGGIPRKTINIQSERQVNSYRLRSTAFGNDKTVVEV